MTNFSLTTTTTNLEVNYDLAPLPHGSTQPLTMSSREIAELLGLSDRHDNVKRTIERLADRGTIVRPPLEDEPGVDSVGRPRPVRVYLLDRRSSTIVVAQLSPEFTARVIDRWQELEEQVRSPVFTLPDFTNPSVAARAWADEHDGRLIAERTKAEIGHRREATAMNTASQAVKRANRLERELDQSCSYATVKRMGMLYHGQAFKWGLLRKTSEELGLPSIEVFDQNYGTVKAYHADVWLKAYALKIPGPSLD